MLEQFKCPGRQICYFDPGDVILVRHKKTLESAYGDEEVRQIVLKGGVELYILNNSRQERDQQGRGVDGAQENRHNRCLKPEGRLGLRESSAVHGIFLPSRRTKASGWYPVGG